MRFVAQGFVKLMEKYPFLETAAFVVILILGVKLSISVWTHFAPYSPITIFLDSEKADLYISILTVGIFVLPLITSLLFGWPKRNENAADESENIEQ
jgi:predicted tellurium resistance membrane protein TerC